MKTNFVKQYVNADLNKHLILSENHQLSGIYKWENNMTKEIYIGSAIHLKKRLIEYYRPSYLTHPTRGRSIICYALIKYGFSNFNLEILEYCSKEELIEKEQYYLDLLNPEYNIFKYAYSSLGYKHTLEAIQKISQAKKGQFKGENNAFFGKNHTNEVKELMRTTALKRNKPNNAKPIILFDSNKVMIQEFKSITELSAYLKADKATLAKYRNTGTLFRGLYYIQLKGFFLNLK
jgi:group I intron endonuclease